jgi:Lrp/AsnC family leucine-responsive transcriptional regulator
MHRVTGDDCSVLLVVVEDIPAFEVLLDRLSIYGQSTSSMVLDELLPWSPVLPPARIGRSDPFAPTP